MIKKSLIVDFYAIEFLPSDQTKIHISHASTIAKELNPMIGYLKGAGFEVTTDLDNPEASMDSRLIICLLTARLDYFLTFLEVM